MEEIENWIEIRGGTSHADRDKFLFEHDVIPILGRVKTAALDVLINKVNWRNTDSQRRELWKVPSGPLDQKMGLFVAKGKDVKLKFSVLDDFGVFGLDFSSMNNPPSNWYMKTERVK